MLISSAVFKDITEKEIEEFKALNALFFKSFEKGEVILYSGETTERIGIVQSGSIFIESVDPWGNKSILSSMGEGNVFAESYCLSSSPLMVDVVAKEESTILFINIVKLLDEKYKERGWYIKLMKNMLSVSSKKNMVLSNRIFCTSGKTIRSRLLTYFSGLYAKTGSLSFTIPFDREELAQYLNVERTALSKELGRMKRDGLIEWRKNFFHLMIEMD